MSWSKTWPGRHIKLQSPVGRDIGKHEKLQIHDICIGSPAAEHMKNDLKIIIVTGTSNTKMLILV